ncbi:hypothetical protein DYBT9275_04396 [Dyadobacter sp. CECT 9275]|uniref:Peptidyl-prolyl cis-trans isomerase n=1 Tax=Dyadobacter helix TaxID=2822344 RepID=A0A916JGF7_9BACT|nr:FKBP-type peptidyl-prolyl cis-trans isomerase [Dyadobacter sp. CECT 9275]CAG5008978.1 hypothetical protein DYBT9275_04396 [Dyadobacter sp. CECT 9275]
MNRIYLLLCLSATMVVSLSGCLKSDNNRDEEMIRENEMAIESYLKADSLGSRVIKDTTGLYYITRKPNPTGEKPKVGDAATVKISGYLLSNGTKVISAVDDKPISFSVGGFVLLGGIERSPFLMRTGEKTTFLLPYYLAYGAEARTNVPAYSPIRLEMELIKTRTELQQIDEYILEKKFVVTERTPENLFIIRTDTTTGPPIGSGKSVRVKYVGRFLDGTKFDEDTPTVTTNTGQWAKGFDLAIQKLPAKGKAIIVFPSSLGYGATGKGPIMPYTPLQFEIEIL